MRVFFVLTICSLGIALNLRAQEANDESGPASWLDSRIVSSQSSVPLEKGEWRFRIDHRFGSAEEGLYDMFGLDAAEMRIGLEYGLFEKVSLGLGRSTEEKMYDGFVKASLMEGYEVGGIRLSISLFCDAHLSALRWAVPERNNYFSSRLSYSFQMPVSIGLHPNYTIVLIPTLMHRNLVPTINDAHDLIAIGVGSSWRLTDIVSFSSEYFYVLPNQLGSGFYHPLMLSCNFNTSGHIFQLVMGNSQAMNNRLLLSNTSTRGLDKVFLGFNLSRRFSFSSND